MSLQVWLPLNGTLENLGLDSFVFTQSIVAGYESGKIGQAIQMKNSNVIFIAPSLIDAKIFSVAFWYKAIADDTITTNWNKVLRFQTKNADGTSGSDFRFESSYATTYADTYGLSVHNNPSQSMGTVGHQIIGPKGSWHHACFTHTPSDNYTYLDGVQIAHGTGAAGTLTGRIYIAGNSPYPNGLMNDLRVYDHALSQKEVKELSKGLVAHYPLNDFVGNPNLVSYVIAGGRTTVLGKYTVRTTGENLDTYFRFNTIEPFASGSTYTISMDVENLAYDNGLVFSVGDQSTTSDKYCGRISLKNGHNTFTFTCPSGLNDLSQSILDDVNRGGAVGQNVLISNFKLEKGSVVTPWIPNTQDDLYSAMGLNEGIVYDCSGYNNHGENTRCIASSDSARYKVSTAFDGSSYITLHNDSFPVILSNDFTLSMWIYSDDDGDRSLWLGNYGISNGGNFFGFEKTASNGVRFWWNNGSPDKNFATYVTKSEAWVLLTLVKEGNVVKIYKNGVLSATNTSDLYVSASLSSTATTFRLGADGRITGNTLFKGSMSDVRIYCTALSAEDIKALYETSISVDDKGNFHTYEISEV